MTRLCIGLVLCALTLMVSPPAESQTSQTPPAPSTEEQAASAGPSAQSSAGPSARSNDDPSAAAAEPGQVNLSLTPDTTTVGGRVRAEITVVWMGGEPTEPVRFPTWQESWGDAEILTKSSVDAFVDQSGRYVTTQVLELAAFDTGDINLPPRTFSVPLADRTVELSSERAGFVVSSVLPGDEETAEPTGASAAPGSSQGSQGAAPGADPAGEELQARGAAGVAGLDANPAMFWASTAALTLLLLAGLGLLRRELARDMPGDADGDAEYDAYSALEPLAELKARLEQIDPLHGGAAHTGLSLALRRFLGRSLGFNAVESTTTEIQRVLLASTPRLRVVPTATLAQRSLEVLRASDLVKFAGLNADPATVRGRVSEVLEIGGEVDRLVERVRALELESSDQPAEEAA